MSFKYPKVIANMSCVPGLDQSQNLQEDFPKTADVEDGYATSVVEVELTDLHLFRSCRLYSI